MKASVLWKSHTSYSLFDRLIDIPATVYMGFVPQRLLGNPCSAHDQIGQSKGCPASSAVQVPCTGASVGDSYSRGCYRVLIFPADLFQLGRQMVLQQPLPYKSHLRGARIYVRGHTTKRKSKMPVTCVRRPASPPPPLRQWFR